MERFSWGIETMVTTSGWKHGGSHCIDVGNIAKYHIGSTASTWVGTEEEQGDNDRVITQNGFDFKTWIHLLALLHKPEKYSTVV